MIPGLWRNRPPPDGAFRGSAAWAAVMILAGGGLARGGEAVVTALLSASQIRAGDPVYLKILIENRTAEPIAHDLDFAASDGTLRVEIRRPGGSDFVPTNCRLQGLACVYIARRRSLVVQPGEQLSKLETVFVDRRQPVFAEPGLYEVQVAIAHNGGVEGRSPPVPLLVTEAPPAEYETIRGLAGVLWEHVGAAGPAHGGTAAGLAWVRDQLGPCGLRRSLEWTIQTLAVRYALTAKEQWAERDSLDRLRDDLPPIEQEMLTLVLAEHWRHGKRYGDALEALKGLPEASLDRRRLKYRVSEVLREQVEALGDPPGFAP